MNRETVVPLAEEQKKQELRQWCLSVVNIHFPIEDRIIAAEKYYNWIITGSVPSNP